ncbi:MAG: c-type cytochrome [Kofleriaceae bacterium]|nr:c-type cytochrome [Kofleriaceae bacterium]
MPLCVGAVVAATTQPVTARRPMSTPAPAPTFELENASVGGLATAAATPGFASSNAIAAISDGTIQLGAIAIDEDSGALVRTNRSGKLVARLPLRSGAAQLVYDPQRKLAYVTDRTADRVVVVEVSATGLKQRAAFATDGEPFGIALSPDKQTLLVTAIADRTLTAFDPANGTVRWKRKLSAEPRGVAISADGKRAAIAYLETGTVDYLMMSGEVGQVRHVTLQATARSRNAPGEAPPRAFARNSFAVQFMGNNIALVPFQRSVPVQDRVRENTDSYGGGFSAPITQHLAFVGFQNERINQAVAHVSNHQVRALAWDGTSDTLYLAGLGNDTLVAIRNASQNNPAAQTKVALNADQDRCGPTGLAIASDGSVAVWCSFRRSVATVFFTEENNAVVGTVSHGATLVASALSTKQHQGMVAFHIADARTSAGGAMACSSCHPDGRTDGLTWRIEKNELQTPVLAGRIAGTHPYKWDGGDKNLAISLTSTVRRLGGMGIDANMATALAAYLEKLPRPRAPTRNPDQVARGKALFESAAVGCNSCHHGAAYTDNESHALDGTLANVDTPSLIGLAASAPYYHDGSAATLPSMLRNHGMVFGMADTDKLNSQQVADLTAFLESL